MTKQMSYTQIIQSQKESQQNVFSLDHVYIGLALEAKWVVIKWL